MVGGAWRITIDGSGGTGGQPPLALQTDSPAARGSEQDPREDADFGATPEPAAAVDPEAQALRLLHDQLGARPVEEG